MSFSDDSGDNSSFYSDDEEELESDQDDDDSILEDEGDLDQDKTTIVCVDKNKNTDIISLLELVPLVCKRAKDIAAGEKTLLNQEQMEELRKRVSRKKSCLISEIDIALEELMTVKDFPFYIVKATLPDGSEIRSYVKDIKHFPPGYQPKWLSA